MATKKIINVEPEAPSAEQALYDVAFEEVGEDGVTNVTHQTMTEQEVITETDAEAAQELIVDNILNIVQPIVQVPQDVVVEATPLTIEQEGYAMYVLGGDLGQNPYMDITEEYFAWNAGWAKGFDEANQVK